MNVNERLVHYVKVSLMFYSSVLLSGEVFYLGKHLVLFSVFVFVKAITKVGSQL